MALTWPGDFGRVLMLVFLIFRLAGATIRRMEILIKVFGLRMKELPEFPSTEDIQYLPETHELLLIGLGPDRGQYQLIETESLLDEELWLAIQRLELRIPAATVYRLAEMLAEMERNSS